MDSVLSSNLVELSGTAAGEAVFSHQSREREFYVLPLAVRRLSGAVDQLNLILGRELLEGMSGMEGRHFTVRGELRSFNNRSGTGNRLVITVFVRELRESAEEDRNSVLLSGTLCKRPNYRRTPMGREICDLMLAVNRRYGRSDYLPCIAWGQLAAALQYCEIGEELSLRGRLQSRKYIKMEDGVGIEKTAFEVSVMEVL